MEEKKSFLKTENKTPENGKQVLTLEKVQPHILLSNIFRKIRNIYTTNLKVFKLKYTFFKFVVNFSILAKFFLT